MSQSADATGSNLSPAHVKAAKGQPSGLWVLFITEMWERFNYYGMRALLVYYLAAKTTSVNFGFGWDKSSAMDFYAWYTSLVYLTPILGGWLADKFLGTHRSMLLGGAIIAAGEFCLAGTELWGRSGVDTVLFGTAPAPFITFMGGLFLIIVGTGFFKPCVSVMVGQLYDADDQRRDSGFTIFYMGINVGALLSGLIAGPLGETVGWHWGFFAAGVGMIFGLIVYSIFRPFFLKGVGLPPHHQPNHAKDHQPTPQEIEQARLDELERTRPLSRVDWDRLIVVVVLSTFTIGFWAVFEQAGSSLNFFALDRTDRSLWGGEFPATLYQSANPLGIVLLAPLFAALWAWLSKRGMQPSTPVKFGMGLAILGIACIAMIIGSMEAGSPRPVEIADAPPPVQAALNARRQIVEECRRKNARPEKASDEDAQADEKEAKDEEKKEEAEEQKVFDVLEVLTYDNAEYYSVAFEEERAIVFELYAATGELLRRRAEPKAEESEVVAVREAPPEEITLENVPETARAALLAQTGGHPIKTLQSTVKAKKPVLETWKDKDGTQCERTHYQHVRVFEASWEDKSGDVRVGVREDALVLFKHSAAFSQVGLAGPQWLLLFYLLATCGELCLSPVGLSMVTRLTPARYTSFMMGFFFCTTCIGNFTAGKLAAYSEQLSTGKYFTLLGGQADFFLMLCIAPLCISAVVFVLSPKIKSMMHGL